MAGMSSRMKHEVVCYDHSDIEEDGADDDSLSLEKLNLGPRKNLLVISLGGLLCHRLCRKDMSDMSKIPKHCSYDAAYKSYIVFKRPYCEDFMKFCLERFDVAIWSSAMERYLNNALDCIMGGLASKLLFAWDQNECTDSGFRTLEKKEKPIFLKELSKVWENKYPNLPWRMGEYSSSNTLLIDNEPYKALLNPPHTAIFPTEYKANYNMDDNALGPEGNLRLYLEGLAQAEDVPSYVKKHPFGQPAITAKNPNWKYYSKIIKQFRRG